MDWLRLVKARAVHVANGNPDIIRCPVHGIALPPHREDRAQRTSTDLGGPPRKQGYERHGTTILLTETCTASSFWFRVVIRTLTMPWVGRDRDRRTSITSL